jgi:hypothetical protein
MQRVDREAEWLVALATAEDSPEDVGAAIEHWLLEDFADIVPQSADLEHRTA